MENPLSPQLLFSLTGTLSTSQPYDFSKSLMFFRDFVPLEGEQVTDDASILKAVSIGGHAVAFKIQAEGSVQNPRISYTAYSEQKIPENALRDRLRFFLSLDDVSGELL